MIEITETTKPWILARGAWNDDGVWLDGDVWRDTPLDKPNIQLFRDNDEYSARMFNVTNDVHFIQAAYYWLFIDTFQTSQYFGEFLYDNQLSDLAEFFTREYWIRNFPAIISALSKAGTFEAYIEIITSALGETNVTFENPNPSHLIIRLDQPTAIYGFGAWHNLALAQLIPDQVQYPNSELAVGTSTAPLTVNETLKMIELLNVNGVFVEVIFNA
jgi:hypothetical protein